MLTVEIKINGNLLAYLSFLNTTPGQDKCVYSCSFIQTKELGKSLTFQVDHKRWDGAERLVEIGMKQVNKLLKEENGNEKIK